MTESPQQPGYSAAQQQQQQAAAYAAQQQQQAYATQQAYAQPAPNVFDKLPMNIQTLGLAAGGALLLLLGSLIMGAENLNIVTLVSEKGSFALVALYGIIALTGIAITTGPKYRNTYRAIVTGLTALELGNIVAMFLSDDNPDEGALIIGIILYIFALGCMTAATFTMAEKPAVDPHQLAAMQAAQAQQAAQQQAAAQQAAAQQQYQASQGLHQPTGEQPTTWQQPQQPPQQ